MNIKSFIRTAVIAIFGILFFSVSSYAQFNMFGPGNYSPQRQGESAFEYGKRIAEESKKRAQYERCKYMLSCTWPEDMKYTGKKRLYLEQTIIGSPVNGSLSAEPGREKEGIEIILKGNTIIGYVEIDAEGNYKSEYYSPIGFLESGSAGSKYVTGKVETGDVIIIVDATISQMAFFQEDPYLITKKIYDSTIERSVNESMYVPGINYDALNMNVDNSSGSKSRSSSRSTCSSCGGTGVDRAALSNWGGVSSYLGYYNSSGSRCPYCNRMDQHYHSKCTKCNVPRY